MREFGGFWAVRQASETKCSLNPLMITRYDIPPSKQYKLYTWHKTTTTHDIQKSITLRTMRTNRCLHLSNVPSGALWVQGAVFGNVTSRYYWDAADHPRRGTTGALGQLLHLHGASGPGSRAALAEAGRHCATPWGYVQLTARCHCAGTTRNTWRGMTTGDAALFGTTSVGRTDVPSLRPRSLPRRRMQQVKTARRSSNLILNRWGSRCRRQKHLMPASPWETHEVIVMLRRAKSSYRSSCYF